MINSYIPTQNSVHKIYNYVALHPTIVPLSEFETLQKESQEEAEISPEISQNAVYDKTITYKSLKYNGLRNDIVHIYDIKLPENFIPKAIDGEIT